eukprot:3679867-Pyramimonas_sp.AAC.2
MACGLAPVATRFSYARWALQRGRGTLVDFDDAGALAGAVAELATRPQARLRLARAAWEFAQVPMPTRPKTRRRGTTLPARTSTSTRGERC